MKLYNMTAQIKATVQCFPVALFITSAVPVVLTLSLWMESCSVTTQINSTEQFIPVVHFEFHFFQNCQR